MSRSFIARYGLPLALAPAIAVFAAPADALTITGNLITNGNPIGTASGVIATNQPASVVGGGNLRRIFNTAASYWQGLIRDPFNLTINYGWGNTGSNATLAFEQTEIYAGAPQRITVADIVVRSQNNPNWFADPTPLDNSEYNAQTTSFANAALCNTAVNCVGIMTTGFVFSGPNGNAVNNLDLLSVVIHEIGHALGLDVGYAAYRNETAPDNDIDLTAPRAFAGANIFTNNTGTNPPGPVTFNAHLNPNLGNQINALMQPNIGVGERRLISNADLLADCQLSQFQRCRLTPAAVPEPASVLSVISGLIAGGLMGLIGFWRAPAGSFRRQG
jgi:hypothetical protein